MSLLGNGYRRPLTAFWKDITAAHHRGALFSLLRTATGISVSSEDPADSENAAIRYDLKFREKVLVTEDFSSKFGLDETLRPTVIFRLMREPLHASSAMGPHGAAKIAEVIRIGCPVGTVHLSKNGIDDQGIKGQFDDSAMPI